MFVCVEYVAAITRYSVVAAWFCLIIRSYSLNVAFEIGCTEIRLYCNCDIVCWIYKYKYWKFISFCRLNIECSLSCEWQDGMETDCWQVRRVHYTPHNDTAATCKRTCIFRQSNKGKKCSSSIFICVRIWIWRKNRREQTHWKCVSTHTWTVY